MQSPHPASTRSPALHAVATVAALAGSLLIAACTSPQHAPADRSTLLDFDATQLPAEAVTTGAALALVPATHPHQAGRALEVRFDPAAHFSGFKLQPTAPWDWSGVGHFSLALDIANPAEWSIHLYAVVEDSSGATHTRSVNIPANSSGTYLIELSSELLNDASGLRDNPPLWPGDATKFIWMWGTKNLDLARIRHVRFFVEEILHSKRMLVDNVRLLPHPPFDPKVLVGLVDAWGQGTRTEFALKIRSDAELRTRADAERAALAASGPMPDRSRFGGWKDGPRRRATGFFRTEKVDGKWWLVDPEGYLYFASGIANLRMANTTTMTGVDFREPTVRTIDPEDVTPEDSKGLLRTTAAARATRFIASETRHKMFEWLPPYDHPLGAHYSYERSVHQGPVAHGESFSFYQANLQRRYGETTPGSYLATWRDVTAARMLDWGFTCFGNWTDPMFYAIDRVPYFANGWIIGDFKTVSSGDDYWAPLPDPFDPEFVRRARRTVQTIAAEVKGSPWCIGVFVDNEKSWGRTGRFESHYGIVIHALKADAAASPAKARFTALLRDKYTTIAALNAAWGTAVDSWETFARGHDHAPGQTRMQPDYAMLLEAFAAEYFSVVRRELRAVLPNHLYMGARMAHWGMTPEIVKAAKAHTDVVSYNYYKESVRPEAWAFLAEIDMPSIIGEFHMGATDTGLFHPGLIMASDQADRARMYSDYMLGVIDNPHFVGAHWFQYIDSPVTGRAFDGENYNVGFVTMTDQPYPEMVAAAKELHRTLYERRHGAGARP